MVHGSHRISLLMIRRKGRIILDVDEVETARLTFLPMILSVSTDRLHLKVFCPLLVPLF